jgi:hypothetical protein
MVGLRPGRRRRAGRRQRRRPRRAPAGRCPGHGRGDPPGDGAGPRPRTARRRRHHRGRPRGEAHGGDADDSRATVVEPPAAVGARAATGPRSRGALRARQRRHNPPDPARHGRPARRGQVAHRGGRAGDPPVRGAQRCRGARLPRGWPAQRRRGPPAGARRGCGRVRRGLRDLRRSGRRLAGAAGGVLARRHRHRSRRDRRDDPGGDAVPDELRGSGYGLLGLIQSFCDPGASLVVGLLWSPVSPVLAFGYAAAWMGAAVLATLMPSGGRSALPQGT